MSSSPDLPPTIASLVSTRPTRTHTRRFVDLCHRVALAYLRQKRKRGRLSLSRFNMTLEDLAMDSIADLFERDDEGRFVEIVRYYEEIDWKAADDDTLFEATRRLVFSKVNDRLFRHYREADRSLGNIIRNLKRALKKTDVLSLERQAGQLWVEVNEATASEPRPSMPPEFLECYLTPTLRRGTGTKEILQAVFCIFSQQSLYQQRIPLTRLALVVRSAGVRVHLPLVESSDEEVFADEEVERMIGRSVEKVRSAKYESYVGREKADDRTYRAYFQAIQDRLVATYVHRNGHDLTNHRALQQYMVGLSREEYGHEHRAIFEYLSACTRDHLLGQLRRELDFSEPGPDGNE